MRIGVFGGSFDPIHSGHAILLNYLSRSGRFDKIWIMVNRRNPLKSLPASATDRQRIEMTRLVAEAFKNVEVSEIEFELNYPSYTIETLNFLKSRYPDDEFEIIIGSDNWLDFDKWRDYETILDQFGIAVYPRPGYQIIDEKNYKAVSFLNDAPVVEISSTIIRQLIRENQNIRFLVPDTVRDYILKNNIYQISK